MTEYIQNWKLWPITLLQYNYDRICERGWTCGRWELHTEFWQENMIRRNNLTGVGVYVRAILRWNLVIKYDTKTCTGFMCLNDTNQWQDLINTWINLQAGSFLGSQMSRDSAPWSDSIVRVTEDSYLTIYGRNKGSSYPKTNKQHAVEILGQD